VLGIAAGVLAIGVVVVAYFVFGQDGGKLSTPGGGSTDGSSTTSSSTSTPPSTTSTTRPEPPPPAATFEMRPADGAVALGSSAHFVARARRGAVESLTLELDGLVVEVARGPGREVGVDWVIGAPGEVHDARVVATLSDGATVSRAFTLEARVPEELASAMAIAQELGDAYANLDGDAIRRLDASKRNQTDFGGWQDVDREQVVLLRPASLVDGRYALPIGLIVWQNATNTDTGMVRTKIFCVTWNVDVALHEVHPGGPWNEADIWEPGALGALDALRLAQECLG
jgi:hypothetical protein